MSTHSKIITLNTNGIRAAHKKGVFDWLAEQQADFVCIQETKAQRWQLEDPAFAPEGYHCYYNDAEKKGYSGTAVYSKAKPLEVIDTLGHEVFDNEGRYLHVKTDAVDVISLYLPSGSAKDERQVIKYECMDFFEQVLLDIKASGRRTVICGDWNIAHTNADIKNWKGNKKNSGFLPEERAWLDKLFDEYGFVDSFREIEQAPDTYSWWSNRGQAFANNTGWRIDYQILSPNMKGSTVHTQIYKEPRFSDHAACVHEYQWA